MENELNKKIKYVANFYFDDKGLLLDTEVCSGSIIEDLGDTVIFTGKIHGKMEVIELRKNNVFDSKEEAEKRIEAGLAWKERKVLIERVGGNKDFLPEQISAPKVVRTSGNPLRFGEPMVCFGAQGNTWGKEDNPQKVLQIAGAIWEDIETLKNILFVLGIANDYSKKLIGKYIIIELDSLLTCFKRLAAIDENYKINYFSKFFSEFKTLEKKYNYQTIRNKVAAHRDTNIDIQSAVEFWQNITRYRLNKYILMFANHLEDILKLYPNEASLYFYMRNEILRGVIGVQENSSYCTFDEPFNEKPNNANKGSR